MNPKFLLLINVNKFNPLKLADIFLQSVKTICFFTEQPSQQRLFRPAD